MRFIKLPFIACLCLFISCISEENVVVNPGASQEEEGIIVKFDFEDGNEGFVGHYLGDAIEDEVVTDLDGIDNTCGKLYRGESSDFGEWKGYDFKGNDTHFLGLDMGRCGGYFDAAVKTQFIINKDLAKEKTKIKFKYYMPGDFTDWGNNTYEVNIYIEKSDEQYSGEDSEFKYLEKFKASVDEKGWVAYAKNLSNDLPQGAYNLVVEIVGSSAAVDDIRLVEEEE